MTNREDGYMTGRCTNWSKYDVPTIWSTVSDEGDSVSYAQVTAWRETSEAIDRQASTLRAARDELMAGWPPDKSSAAQEFIDQVEAILDTMNQYAGFASANSAALHGIVNALTDAKDKIQPIYSQWITKQVAETQESKLDKFVDTATFWSNEDAWRSDLQKQATAIMLSADASVAEHRQQMQAPIPYDSPWNEPASTPDDTTHDQPGGRSATLGIVPPSINPLLATTQPLAAVLASAGGLPAAAYTSSLNGVSNQYGDSVNALLPNLPNGGPITSIFPGIRPTNPTFPTSIAEAAQPNQNRGAPGTSKGTEGIAGEAFIPTEGVITGRPAASGRITRAGSAINGSGGVIGGKSLSLNDSHTQKPRKNLEPPASGDSTDPWAITAGGPAVISASNEIHDHSAGAGVIGIDR